jgi:threonylcarbamoyladenosine tRNA methylthiotransferase MtaB
LSSSVTIPLATLFRSSASILGPVFADDSFAHSWIEHAQVTPGLASDSQTRPNLKIQEGCSNRCTFCVIPTTRGGSRSMPAVKVLAQVLGFVQSGGNELVLSGINLGRWGRDIPKAPSFASLVRQILSTTNLTRLRLSSIEPMDWSPELIGLFRDFSNGRLARHAHLPLQSGCDAVLRRMHRRYRPWHYAHKVTDLLAAAGPQLAIGADVMVGFPGETDAEFRETCDFIASLPFAYLHLFPFSPRPGTPGWDLHRCHPVPAAVVRERMTELRQLADAKKRAFRTSCVDSPLPAITMHSSPAQLTAGVTPALTDNFLPVELTEILPPNQLIHVNIHEDVGPLGALRATSQPYAHMAMAI